MATGRQKSFAASVRYNRKIGLQVQQEKREAEQRAERMKLGIFCLECGEVCHLSEDGKRWLCRDERHN